MTPGATRLIPLADGANNVTSLVWKTSNETPALRTVITAVEKHLVDQQPRGRATSPRTDAD